MSDRQSAPDLQVVEAPGPYVYFVLSAFCLTLLGGPVVGVLLWLSRSGLAFASRQEALIQAHGAAQLLGWAGLFVAGFSLRLAPRFAGQPERSAPVALGLLAALVTGVLLRAVGQVGGGGWVWISDLGGALTALGMIGVAFSLAATLRHNRHPHAPWALLLWMAAGWWAVWAVLSVVAGIAIATNGLVPLALDRATVWVVTLGAIGNVIWAVQSRMMPISFGRKPLSWRSIIVPLAAYNVGIALILGSLGPRYGLAATEVAGAMERSGLGIAGAATIWLAASCGSLNGEGKRLRPASQPLARFIVWADRWAVLAGLLLVLLSLQPLLGPGVAIPGLEDAALHGMGAGLITILIAGMLQLVAPAFAMERIGRTRTARLSPVVWGLLMVAAVARVAAAPASSWPGWFAPLAGLSAVAGWSGLALLAAALVRARGRTAAD